MRFRSWKLRQDKFRFETQISFLTLKVVKCEHNLPRNVADSVAYGPFILVLNVPLKHIPYFKQLLLRGFCGYVLLKVKQNNLLVVAFQLKIYEF